VGGSHRVGAFAAQGRAIWRAVGGEQLRMITQYPIGGNDTGYDYLRLDAATQPVFVAHANRVEV